MEENKVTRYLMPNVGALSTQKIVNYGHLEVRINDSNNGVKQYSDNPENTRVETNIIKEMQEFNFTFQNVSFGELANLFQNFSINAQWDTRDNLDFQTVLLIRRHMFYTIKSNNYLVNQDGTLLSEIFIPIQSKPISPIHFFSDFQKKLKKVDPSIDDTESVIGNKKQQIEENVTNSIELGNMIHRNNCRKYSENHFAISKINLISHKIEVNGEVFNSVSTSIFKKEKENNSKLLVTILNDPNKEIYRVKPVNTGVNIIGQELDENNLYLQIEASVASLIKELEMVYSGRIYMLYNRDIQYNDTITLIDETSSVYGIFKVESFEHVLDNRGLITIVDVVALWDIKDPTLDHFSTSIGYKLSKSFSESFNPPTDDLDAAENVDKEVDEDSIVQKIFGVYLKTLTQNVKYTSILTKYENADEFQSVEVALGNLLMPTPLPLRFMAMIKKGKAEIPTSIESAFFNQYPFGNHKWLFARFQEIVARHISSFLHTASIGVGSFLRITGDMLLSVVTLNLHELFKPMFGITSSKAYNAISDKTIGPQEFKDTGKNRYNPFTNNPLGRKYAMTIAFFNTRLQSLQDLLPDNAPNHTFTKEEVERLVTNKAKIAKNFIANIFDYTLLVELYDGFNGTNEGNLRVDGWKYSYKDYVNSILPDLTDFAPLYGKLMSNRHGNEYGAAIGKLNYGVRSIGTGSNSSNLLEEERERSYLKTEFIVPESELLRKTGVKKIVVFWFHALYGVSKMEKVDVQSSRRQFISAVIRDMEVYLKENKDCGVVLMADCNAEIVNKGSNPTFTPASSSQNLVYYLDSKELVSKVHNKTSLKKDNTVNNVFDNIVISKNLEEYVVCSTYNYPYQNKRELSDHIPVYIGIK